VREQVGVSKYNPFIFARPHNGSVIPLRGSDCLREFVQSLKLQQSQLVNSTKLRKYIATIWPVFNLQEKEIEWLATHLGHDIKVHREFYRLHHSAIELTKISKLLMAVDNGQTSKFAGKKLDENDLKDKCTSLII